MIEKIREYFLNPQNITLAEDFGNMLADFLGKDAVNYSIEPVPVEPKLTPYADGSYLGQYQFYLGSREYFDDSVLQNINNLNFYDEFKDKIESNNRKHILPDIKGIQSIECLSHGGIQAEEQNGTAKYVIQMRITYFKDYNDDNIVSL